MKEHSPHRAGFALVLSLIMLALLSIAVVGFLSSSGLDRATAHAAANKAHAELAAQAAANSAISLVSENILRYPDSATAWDRPKQRPGDVSPLEGTMLYYSDQLPNTPGANRKILPLFSTGLERNQAVDLVKKDSLYGTDSWDDTNSIDINRRRFDNDDDGWVGKDPINGRRPLRAKWVEVKESKEDPNSKVISRYAFWVEDESFRLNLNQLGDQDRGKDTFSPGKLVQEIPYQGLLRVNRLSDDDQKSKSYASSFLGTRNLFLGGKLPELRSFNETPDVDSSLLIADRAKFLTTVHSGGLNMSRHGTQRLNLNGLGFENTGQSPKDTNKSLRQIVETIKFHAPKFGQRFYRSTVNTSPAVLNTEDAAITPQIQNIYYHKIAANIKDYIDRDTFPTMIMPPSDSAVSNYGVIAPKAPPDLAFSSSDGDNQMWAQGKDSAPYLQEAMARFRGEVNGSAWKLKIDYYLEFWNMTDKDVYAGTMGNNLSLCSNKQDPDAFVQVSDQVGWFATNSYTASTAGESITPLQSVSPNLSMSPSQTNLRDLKIDIVRGVRNNTATGQLATGGVVFRAGTCTVITTDPDGLPDKLKYKGADQNVGGSNSATTYYCPNLIHGSRTFSGNLPPGFIGFRPKWRDTDNDDYGTEVVLGNAQGYLESMPFALTGGGPAPVTSGPDPKNPKAASQSPSDTAHGGSLLGNNNSPSQLGDPRTNNEQLSITRFRSGSTGQPDQTRYFNQTGSITLGSPNAGFVNPHSTNRWPDYYKGWEAAPTNGPSHQPNPTNLNAPMFVLNDDLQSIGQLGDIYDPARVLGTVGTKSIYSSRGGGRTFKIGQPDDRIEQPVSAGTLVNPQAASRQWASYRLTDFFSTKSDIQLPGLVNINGVGRDQGAALRAACYKMSLHSVNQAPTVTALDTKDKDLNIVPGSNKGLDALIKATIERINPESEGNGPKNVRYAGPLMERGELGEFDIFNKGVALLDGISMENGFDRTREELSRRLMELITTRGSIFSVYCVGQSITEGPAPLRKRYVTGTHQVKVTFQLVPVWNRSDYPKRVEKESWNPEDTKARTERFSKPDHIDVQILQVSS